MAYVIKFDPSRKKTKSFYTIETNNSEKHDALIEIWFNKMTECISNTFAFLFCFISKFSHFHY